VGREKEENKREEKYALLRGLDGAARTNDDLGGQFIASNATFRDRDLIISRAGPCRIEASLLRSLMTLRVNLDCSVNRSISFRSLSLAHFAKTASLNDRVVSRIRSSRG